MADGTTTTQDGTVESGSGNRGLTYPLGAPPAPGQAVQAAPGLLLMRQPLPMSLDHIPVSAIQDGEGWVLIDTGLNLPASAEAWEAALAGPLGGKAITRVICTHMHPDHVGMAGWLCERSDAPLLMSRLEYVTLRLLISDTGQPAPQEGVDFYRAAGWSEAQIGSYRKEFGRFGRLVSSMPQSYRRLSEGDDIAIGDDQWRVVIGNGHSPEHVCLWRQSDDVFISGDQILPRISSNVSVWPTEPLQDPLSDWLNSIDKLRGLLSAQTFVLPAHGEPFTGVHTRLDALKRGHETGLRRLERTLRTPKRSIDVFSSLFARPIGEAVFGMATGESIAHLNCLENRGLARRERDADGVDWWVATQPQPLETTDTDA
ncbi:MAG: beta-lactamase protein [Brevundimonas sp.]|nr:beta-lactamase protein [Brevundimonas sp.]